MPLYIIFIIILLIVTIAFANYIYNDVLASPSVKIIDTNPFGYCNISEPHIKPFELKNILNEYECNELINYCSNQKTDNGNRVGNYVNDTDNLVCWIPQTNLIVKPIVEKLSNMFKIPVENAENVRITRYYPYQSFKDRYESCCDDIDTCRDFMNHGGHRKVSILVYLTDNYNGGETVFDNIGLSFKPKHGDGIVIYPLNSETNKCHPALAYSSTPIDAEIKWVANISFRESAFV